MRLYNIAKEIKGSITNKYLKKLMLHHREYEWTYYEGIKSNDGTTMLYRIFKSINPATRIVVSNLKDEIEKAILAKILNNVKDLLDEMFSNYSIIIDKG